MQAFETSATVEAQGEVRVAGVPFAPGTQVEVTITPLQSSGQSARAEDRRGEEKTKTGAASPTRAEDLELHDWNRYYELLLAGELDPYRGRFVVVLRGKVVAAGEDPRELRRQVSAQEGIAPDLLVIPFVDDKECLSIQ